MMYNSHGIILTCLRISRSLRTQILYFQRANEGLYSYFLCRSAPAKRKGIPRGLKKVYGVSPELQTIVGEPTMPKHRGGEKPHDTKSKMHDGTRRGEDEAELYQIKNRVKRRRKNPYMDQITVNNFGVRPVRSTGKKNLVK